jgi:glyoxylase-like metal-dependent hydrolase (beta-lactamase superfamily II)
MSEADYLTAHALRERSAGFGIEALLRHLHRHGLAGPRYEAQADRINSRRSPWADFPDCFRRLMDGDQLSIGGRNWQVLVGHGHAPEHVSLYCPALDLLISGDMLLPRISTNISVGPVEPDADPLALFLASLRRLASVVGRDPLVLPSHGPPFRGLHARVAQLEAHHADRLAELEQVCAEPRCAADVIDTLFRRELDVHQTFFAMGEALAHLNHLMHAGRCTRQTGPDGILRFVRSATS